MNEILEGRGGRAIVLQANSEGKIIMSPGLAATVSHELKQHIFPTAPLGTKGSLALEHDFALTPIHPNSGLCGLQPC